ncbi:hypothetical protein [Nonomuraea zeae]|uniref:hypothetical protein n=1 Tax=Nonomuraea zeae TaxID=1642303 RepID=UPI0036D372A3
MSATHLTRRQSTFRPASEPEPEPEPEPAKADVLEPVMDKGRAGAEPDKPAAVPSARATAWAAAVPPARGAAWAVSGPAAAWPRPHTAAASTAVAAIRTVPRLAAARTGRRDRAPMFIDPPHAPPPVRLP